MKVKLFEDFLQESRGRRKKLKYIEFVHKGKKIKLDPVTVQIEDMDMDDYPDFSDAWISSAKDINGRKLTDDELETFNDEYYGDINYIIHDRHLYQR